MSIKQNGGVFGRNPTFNDVTIDGTLTFDGALDINSDINLPDNKKITFGDGNDLELYHSGSHSIIKETGTGQMRLQASTNVQIWDENATKLAANFNAGGTSTIYFNGNAKIASTNTGANITGNLEATGNVIIGTSGNGIDFSATAGTGTSELLDDYEEGVFIATLAPATSGTITLVSTTNELAYTKVGRQVFINGLLIVDSVSSPVGASVKLNLPFTSANLGDGAGRSAGVSVQNTSGAYLLTPIYSFEAVVEAEIIFDASTVTAGHRFYVSLSYITA
tara:strand:+ start:1584 stop:2417 length:834 start_codon:yes stop_codon:yes gene_type:complete